MEYGSYAAERLPSLRTNTMKGVHDAGGGRDRLVGSEGKAFGAIGPVTERCGTTAGAVAVRAHGRAG